ncbi:hypothetical protein N658DRAFT_498366 [Parathielavia hyrcaniae]|uniref:Uncharacterized protein n=1 Tax=Parathielavia hyrcaniae TaxID=113614 RepID=A0AAN6PX52_9PEZI|nr:hypothetical protein N658DRAFT_498366 [Parathielavia hyrcaniae]
MMAPQGLLLETARVEAAHARLKELSRQFRAQEEEARAELDEKTAAIDADVEKRIAEIAQLDSSLREKIEAVLIKTRCLEIEELRRAHQEEADARKKLYDEQKRQYDEEIFSAITAAMKAGHAPSPGHPPILPSRPSEGSQARTPAAVASGPASLAETDSVPPPASDVASQPQQVASPFAMQAPIETDRDSQAIPSQSPDSNNASPPHSLSEHSQEPPFLSRQQPAADTERIEDTRPFAQSAAQSAASPTSPANGHETSPSEALPSPGHRDQRPAPPTLAPKPDPVPKRKANGEPNGETPASSPDRHKRTKFEWGHGERRTPTNPPLPFAQQDAPERTVSFEEVYGGPGRPAPHMHVIVQWPPKNGHYYILRCDEHGVHFGEHPLRGAAKHLASAQHGYMSKAHATAIETLGHRVVGCTEEMANMNNEAVVRAMKDGSYKIFNANNLSQTKRAELGYPPLDPLASQKAAMYRKPTGGVTRPVSGRFYVGNSGGEVYPVLILPWIQVSPVGLVGTLADTGLFRKTTDDGRLLAVPKLPKCYVYFEVAGRIIGIQGWAKGYEDGGPLERKREFPVLCADSPNCGAWTVGWIKAAHLSILDFDDPSSQNIPYFAAARDYFLHRVRQPPNVVDDAARGTPQYLRHPALRGGLRNIAPAGGDDVEMRDAEYVHYRGHGGESDQDIANPAMSHFNNRAGHPDVDSRRTSVSNRDEHYNGPWAREGADVESTAASMHPAQLIAAQALNLQSPARSGFRAINTAGAANGSNSQSPRASVEPVPRGSLASSVPASHRRVWKIHARSSRQPSNQTSPSPSIVLPERPADASNSTSGAPSQLPGDVKKFSPASLQNIVQDFPAPTAGSSRVGSQSPNPAPARRPLPSGPGMRNGSPPRPALISAVNTDRAGSAPVQLPHMKDPVAEEIRRGGSASAVPGSSRHATPQPSTAAAAATATAAPNGGIQSAPPSVHPSVSTPGLRREPPPPPIQVPPPATAFTPMSRLNASPLATPATSTTNTRANSPALPQHQSKTGTPIVTGFPRPDTPTLTPTLSQPTPGAFLPTMDVFDLAGVMEGSTEVFRSTTPGTYLRLIDDHQSGVFTTPSDAPVALRIEPKRVEKVERVSAQGGAVCVVAITYRAEPGQDGERRKQTLVLEKARSTASGMQYGLVHARRLCRRLREWNPEIELPSPGNDLDSVQWRFSTQSPAAAPTSTSAGVVEQEATT